MPRSARSTWGTISGSDRAAAAARGAGRRDDDERVDGARPRHQHAVARVVDPRRRVVGAAPPDESDHDRDAAVLAEPLVVAGTTIAPAGTPVEPVARMNKAIAELQKALKVYPQKSEVQAQLKRFDIARDVITRVQEARVCWLSGTRWHGMEAMRFSVSGWSTTTRDIEMTVESILECYRKAKGRKGRS